MSYRRPMNPSSNRRRLPAEWEQQGAVLLAWPPEGGDWTPLLDRVRVTLKNMVRGISDRARVLVLSGEVESTRAELSDCEGEITVIPMELNDTWTRDYGPVTVLEEGKPILLDFGFNGWGLKFPADRDNLVTRALCEAGYLGAAVREVPGLWLEGGSIESDGQGTLFTSSNCLLSSNRNPHLDRAQIEKRLLDLTGAQRLLWLEHGHLEGDDTDAHIDTLVRPCPGDTLAYVRCDDPADTHFAELCAMEAELKSWKTSRGEAYRLVPLPWARPCFAQDGHRLPATYANFLFVNGRILMPTYADPERDACAIAAMKRACPGWEVVGVDCRVLIEQHGSLHCMTMQIPEEVWTWKN